MFKNVIAYGVTPGFRFDSDLLKRCAFVPCSPISQSSNGFVEPCDHSTDMLVHSLEGMQVICWQTEDKLLPGSVVAEAVKAMAEQMEDQQGYKPGRRQMRDLKECAIAKLLPKAFTVKRKTHAVLTDKYLFINTSSQARANAFMERLIVATQTPFSGLPTVRLPEYAMTDWIISGAPGDLTIDSDSTFEGIEGGKVKYEQKAAGEEQIAALITSGFRVTTMEMTYNNRISFVMNSSKHLKRLSLTDATLLNQAKQEEDAAGSWDADLTLMSLELVKLLDYLVEQLGGIVPVEKDLVNEVAA